MEKSVLKKGIVGVIAILGCFLVLLSGLMIYIGGAPDFYFYAVFAGLVIAGFASMYFVKIW